MPKGNGPRQALFRSEIMDALKAKDASLTVLITDSCHLYHELPSFAPPVPPNYVFYEERCLGIPPLFRSLFFNCNGVVDINSSGRGEAAYCTPMGSVFTYKFVACAPHYIDKFMSWNTFLSLVHDFNRKKVGSPIKDESPLNQSNSNNNQNDVDSSNKYEFTIERISSNINNQKVCIWGSLPPLPELEPKFWKIVTHKKSLDKPSPFESMFYTFYYPSMGDRIIAVNNIKIRNAAHYNQIIRDADEQVKLTLIDHRTGTQMELARRLGLSAPLGIIVQDDQHDGVRIAGFQSGAPIERFFKMKE